MIEDMNKIRIVGPKSLMDIVINYLHRARLLHIVEKTTPGIKCGAPLANAAELSTELVKLRAIASRLDIHLDSSQAGEMGISDALHESMEITEKVRVCTEQIKEAEDAIKKQQDLLYKSKILSALGLDKESLHTYSSIDHYVGSIKNSGSLRSEILGHTDKFLLKHANAGKDEFIALFVEKSRSNSIKAILSSLNFSTIDFSEIKSDKDAKKIIAEEERIKEGAKIALASLQKQYMNRLPIMARVLSQELDKAEAPLRFQETSHTFVIWGFVPKSKSEKVTKELERLTSRKIIIEIHPADKTEKVPVILKNPHPVENFQFFLNLYSLPKYKEIDPSWFLFITFPLFFGFMLGDVGYGVITFILFWLLKRKMPKFSDFFNILMFSSIATVLFGFVFAEFFGTEMYAPIINRNPEHSFQLLIGTAIALGVIHINIGLVAGFFNELRSHGLKRAFFGKFGWIFLQISALLLALAYTKSIHLPILAAYGALVISILMLYYAEGIKGLVEITSIFGNILSYLRLMAIGLSSVGLGMVVNSLANGLFNAGPVSAIFGVIILAVGHIINISIGCLGSFLHSLRLHYVELFSKFYQGGGTQFKPFGA